MIVVPIVRQIARGIVGVEISVITVTCFLPPVLRNLFSMCERREERRKGEKGRGEAGVSV